MRYIVRPKNLSAIFIICFFTLTLIGQGRQMNVPKYSQETGFWCWAACMEMIMDFHIPSNSANTIQCELVRERLLLQNPNFHVTANNCCKICSQNCSSLSTSGECNDTLSGYSIPFPYDPSILIPNYYDRIFEQNGFSSNQEINYVNSPISWEKVKQQIEECRPFILNVSSPPSLTVLSNHAVVVKGYQQGSNSSNHLVVTNDPWEPCCARGETIFPYLSLFHSPSNSSSVYKALSTVYSIKPNIVHVDLSNCIACEALEVAYSNRPEHYEIFSTDTLINDDDGIKEKNNFESDLLSIVNQNSDSVAGFPEFRLEPEVFESYIELEGYYYAPVQYISSSLVRRSGFFKRLFPHRKISRVVLDHPEVIEIVSAMVDKNLVTTFQKSKRGWEVRRISNYTNLEDDMVIKIKNSEQTVKLKNTSGRERNIGRTNFTLLRYLPFTYEFYSFEIEGETYVSPAEKYQNLGLEKGIGYSEREFLNALRPETRIYQEVQKRLDRPNRLFNFLNSNRLSQEG
ncbi:MAG: C39 family peptidase [Bacteroidota bacterium]